MTFLLMLAQLAWAVDIGRRALTLEGSTENFSEVQTVIEPGTPYLADSDSYLEQTNRSTETVTTYDGCNYTTCPRHGMGPCTSTAMYCSKPFAGEPLEIKIAPKPEPKVLRWEFFRRYNCYEERLPSCPPEWSDGPQILCGEKSGKCRVYNICSTTTYCDTTYLGLRDDGSITWKVETSTEARKAAEKEDKR